MKNTTAGRVIVIYMDLDFRTLTDVRLSQRDDPCRYGIGTDVRFPRSFACYNADSLLTLTFANHIADEQRRLRVREIRNIANDFLACGSKCFSCEFVHDPEPRTALLECPSGRLSICEDQIRLDLESAI